jgi:hypothetical protein
MRKLKLFSIMATILVGTFGLTVGSTAQQALADKAAFDDNVKQGGMGEYFSEDGRDEYYGGASGEELGVSIQNYARPGDHDGGHESYGVKNAGSNFALYASGECHSEEPCE